MQRYIFVVLGFIIIDIITGVIKAFYDGNVNSTMLRKGLFHKLSEILALFFGYFTEYATTVIELGYEIPIFVAICCYISVMETVSILENLCKVNPRLSKLFEKYLERVEEDGTKRD